MSKTPENEQSASTNGATPRAWWVLLIGVSGVYFWAYWTTISDLVTEWQTNPNYSVGLLVPPAALYLLWHDRKSLQRCRLSPAWSGIAVILVAQAGRAFGLVWLYESAERYALVLTLVGVVLLVGGWGVFWRTRWILLFLLLMVPLPGRIHLMISGPLQEYATRGAVFGLELLGVVVGRQGNRVMLNDEVPVNIAEACSGLRMLTAFVVVAAVLAYVIGRPRWQKFVLVVSSVPIAVACNVFRLVVTALLFLNLQSDLAERFFHDFAGFTMMPVAVLMLLLEMWVLSKLVVADPAGGVRAVRADGIAT